MRRGVALALAIGASGAVSATASWSPSAHAGRLDAAPTTAAPSSTAATPATAPSTVTPGTAPAGPVASLPMPASEAVDPVRNLVPRVAAIPAVLNTDLDRVQAISLALSDQSTAVAVQAGPGTLCAVVPVSAPLMADGRWERNGEAIASSGEQRRVPPGYGDCVPNDDGERIEDGVYQYVAVGPTGATSAAATIVVGSEPVEVWLLNSGDEPLCLVQMSPEPADYFEAHSAESPLLTGEAMAVTVADVEHDVRVFGCPPDDVRRTFRFVPEAHTYVELFDVPDPIDSSPPVPPDPTTASPTTTATPTTAASATTP